MITLPYPAGATCVSGCEVFDANVLFGLWPRWRLDATPETVARLAARYGIARQLVCSMRGIFHDFVESNDETLRVCRDHEHWVPSAALNPVQLLDALSEVDRMVRRGVRVFRFFPEFQGWDYRLRPFRRVLAHLAEVGAIAMTTARVGPHLHSGVISELAEVLEATGVRCILTGVYYGNFAEALDIARSVPNLYIETHLFNGPDSFEIAAEQLGADRLLYGSYSPVHYIGSSLLPFVHSNLDSAARAAIASGNLVRLLGWSNADH